jgi:predicted TIM-barrel fold metal-dependent hydrolase
MLGIIEEKGLFLSVHTGLQNRDSTDIRKSHPQDLIPLFRKFKNLHFDVFHAGFPYTTESIELAKSWSNVFINLCWNHIISPEGTRCLLSELLECVPVNKILAFGGDVYYPEAVIGHLEIAKENCAMVLAQKVLDGIFSEKNAIEYAERILRTNAIEFYELDI